MFSKNDFTAVEVTNKINPRIKIEPIYFNMGLSTSAQIFARSAVLNRLLNALDLLPAEYGFWVWDIYRPRAVQAKLFSWMKDEVKKNYPQLSNQEIDEKARQFASPPSQIGDAYCPPHLSGGAIDLTLYEIESGKILDMGTPFDDCTEKAFSLFYEDKINLTEAELSYKKHRKVLREAMETSGFTSYEYEWWHFDIGNVVWSRHTKQPEVFGPLFGDKEWPDEV